MRTGKKKATRHHSLAFKEQVLGLVTSSLPGESIDEDAEVLKGALEERLDAILRRVGSL